MPQLDKLLGKNPYLPYEVPDFSIAAGFCVNQFMARMQKLDQFKDKSDFMNSFIKAKEEHPDLVSDNEIIGYLILNVCLILQRSISHQSRRHIPPDLAKHNKNNNILLTILFYVDPRRRRHNRHPPESHYLPHTT
jgi:hypothetical protein